MSRSVCKSVILASTGCGVHTGCGGCRERVGCWVGSKGRDRKGSGGKDAEMQQPAGTTCRAGRFTHATALVRTPSGKVRKR